MPCSTHQHVHKVIYDALSMIRKTIFYTPTNFNCCLANAKAEWTIDGSWTTERTEYTKEHGEGRVIQHNSIGSREMKKALRSISWWDEWSVNRKVKFQSMDHGYLWFHCCRHTFNSFNKRSTVVVISVNKELHSERRPYPDRVMGIRWRDRKDIDLIVFG